MSLPTFDKIKNKRPVIIAKKLEIMRIHFLLKSDVLTFVAVVHGSLTLRHLASGGKKVVFVSVLDSSVVVA